MAVTVFPQICCMCLNPCTIFMMMLFVAYREMQYFVQPSFLKNKISCIIKTHWTPFLYGYQMKTWSIEIHILKLNFESTECVLHHKTIPFYNCLSVSDIKQVYAMFYFNVHIVMISLSTQLDNLPSPL